MVGLIGLARGGAVALLFFGCGGSTTGSEPGPDTGAKPRNDAVRACPGVAVEEETPEGRCRKSDECAPSEWCQAYPPSSCSTGSPQCYTDPDCPVGAVCVDSRVSSCFGRRITICAEPCTTSSCSDGERCESDGHCRPISCTDGFECADDQVCTPDRNADEHGCSAALCEEGYRCPDGFVCEPGDEADANGCVAISCNAGFECPVNQRCNPDSPYLHSHQCDILTCEQDADCDCGYCVNSVCQNDLGYCAPPPIG